MSTLGYSELISICIEIADLLHLNMLLLDQEGNIVFTSKKLQQELGYTSETPFLFQGISELKPTLTPAEWQHYQLELQHQGQTTLPAKLLSSSGSLLLYEATIKLFTLENQHQAVIFCWLRAAEELTDAPTPRLQMLEVSYKAISHANLMIYRLDAQGFFQDTNEILERKLGFQEEELKKMHIFEFFQEKDREAFYKTWQQLLLQRHSMHGEAIVYGKNGIHFPVEWYIAPMGRKEEEGFCGIWTDISDQKKKEAELQQALEEIIKLKEKLETDNQVLQENIKLNTNFNTIISKSPAYVNVLKQVERVADTDTTVLIYGETGTGKELLSSALHQLSRRSERPLVKVHCSALPANLLEAELFGYEKGAFAGAFQQKRGRLEMAHQGTIFLDEIADLPLNVQAKFLRVLQEGAFERMGGEESIHVDIRVVAATNRNLERLVREGKFRQDLYYRLNIFPIYNIPLRERREDIPVLVRHFVEKYAYKLGKPITSIPQKAIDRLMEYNFPGNIRELENLIERAVILSAGSALQLELASLEPSDAEPTTHTFLTMEEMQRTHILEALQRSGGQISGENGAAKLLGMNDKTLYSKMKKLGIARQDYLQEPK